MFFYYPQRTRFVTFSFPKKCWQIAVWRIGGCTVYNLNIVDLRNDSNSLDAYPDCKETADSQEISAFLEVCAVDLCFSNGSEAKEDQLKVKLDLIFLKWTDSQIIWKLFWFSYYFLRTKLQYYTVIRNNYLFWNLFWNIFIFNHEQGSAQA